MKFAKLRLSGFKSFVEPTELHIREGLTGVVGPNGCGKSNLLEALRWVMGESSARSLRVAAGGGGMDDVIFAGTAKRPSRDLAEVRLTLDNSARRGLGSKHWTKTGASGRSSPLSRRAAARLAPMGRPRASK